MSDSIPNQARKRQRWRARFFWALLWLIGLAGVGMLVNYSKTFTDCVHAHKNDNEYQQLRERAGVFAGVLKREGARAGLLYACGGDFADKNNGAIVAFATVIVGLFTFTLWRSTDRLWQASLEHAGHAERAIKVAEETAERQLRAYVFVREAHIIKIDNVLAARIVIKNFGQTPAIDVQHEALFRLDEIPPKTPLAPPNQDGPRSPLPPTGELFKLIRSNGLLSPEQEAAITARQIAFYVYGQIMYRDTFGKDRCTDFRMMQTGEDRALQYCEDGNKAY
jgi:hypothetical protein